MRSCRIVFDFLLTVTDLMFRSANTITCIQMCAKPARRLSLLQRISRVISDHQESAGIDQLQYNDLLANVATTTLETMASSVISQLKRGARKATNTMLFRLTEITSNSC